VAYLHCDITDQKPMGWLAASRWSFGDQTHHAKTDDTRPGKKEQSIMAECLSGKLELPGL